jgi:DNA-directed RNA polymerase specialized sigma24 family protein
MEHLLTDAELLQQSALDPAAPAAFGALYERHGLAVRCFVVRRVGIDDGEDLAAEVFIRAFRARSRYRAERMPSITLRSCRPISEPWRHLGS